MRILRLRFTNLNSLRGDSPVLDFTEAPLAGSGLFAIVGPTGSGKTTILDAMTLALYGCAARYGTTKPEQMMSRHTGECSAEVEFECASGTYRSTWQLHRSRRKADGDLQQPTRRLVELPDGTVIAEKLRDVDAKIIELTGLNFERFLRSVMLAQGEFAAFLKAGANERTELLEQVTGTGVYAEISKAAFQQAREAENALRDLRLKQGEVKLFSEEERTTRLTQIATLSDQVNATVMELQVLEKRLQHAREAQRCVQEQARLQVETTDLETSKKQFSATATQLAAHRRALPLQVPLAAWKLGQQQLATRQAALQQLENQLPGLRTELTNAETALTKATTELNAVEAEEQTLRPLLLQITQLDANIHAATASLTKATQAREEIAKALATSEKEIANSQDALATKRKQEAELNAWLKERAADETLPPLITKLTAAVSVWSEKQSQVSALEKEFKAQRVSFKKHSTNAKTLSEEATTKETAHQQVVASLNAAKQAVEHLAEGKTIGDWETQRTTCETRVQLLTTLQRLSEDRNRLSLAREQLMAKQHSLGELLTTVKTKLDGCIQEGSQTALLVDARRQSLSLAERVQSLESERASLQLDHPCPLCGSLTHPYAHPEAIPSPEIATLKRELKQAEAKMVKLQSELLALRESATKAETEAKTSAETAAQMAQQLEALLVEWAALKSGITPEESSQISLQLGAEQEKRDALSKKIQAIRAAEERVIAVGKQAEATLQEWNAKRLAHASAQSQADAAQALLDEISTKGKTARGAAEAEGTQVANILTQVHESGDSVEGAMEAIQRLTGRHQQWEATTKSLVSLTTAIATLQAGLAEKLTQRDTLRPELEARTMAESSAKDLHQSLATSRIKMFGDKSVEETEIAFNTKLKQTRTSKEDAVQKHQSATHLLTTTANRLREETATLEEARVQQSNVEKSLLDLAISASFSGIAEVESSILESAVVGAFEEQETSLQTRSVALQTKLGQLTRDVENLPAGAVEDAPKLAEIEAENVAKKAAHSTLQAERAVLQDQLNHDSAERQRHEAMASHIQSAELDKERWGKLSQMIGSASGLSFSKFAQGLTLERLVVLANQHLKQLGPRYSLRRDDKKADELELEIVDHYQADAMRSMQSLSGGESFLASLALALGLSELAGGRSPIDSLFIDEGFGTLDADTLEVAMSALENLRATGKTIGVISHVEAMKERITTQIRVIKTDGGGGRLELVS